MDAFQTEFVNSSLSSFYGKYLTTLKLYLIVVLTAVRLLQIKFNCIPGIATSKSILNIFKKFEEITTIQ